MKRVIFAAVAVAAIGGSIGCDVASRANAVKSGAVSAAEGTLVNLKVPNMT